MPKIAILAWFNTVIDQVKVAIDEMTKQGHEALSFDAITLLELLTRSQEINAFYPDLILIWNRHQGLDVLPVVRQLFSGKIIFFNWDDPHSILRSNLLSKLICHHEHKTNPEGIDLCPRLLLDHVFSSCRSTQLKYLQTCIDAWSYLPPFYSPDWHYPEFDPTYVHDVVLVCTNLYRGSNFPGQLFSRYDLVTALDADPDIDFGLYGPPGIGHEFPKSYRGEISYADNHKIFTSAKIALSTHVENGDDYTNERCITILASGGLLLIDPIKEVTNLFGDGCLIMTSIKIEDIIKQIKDILSNYSKYQPIRQRGLEIVKRYHVKNWVKQIMASKE